MALGIDPDNHGNWNYYTVGLGNNRSGLQEILWATSYYLYFLELKSMENYNNPVEAGSRITHTLEK